MHNKPKDIILLNNHGFCYGVNHSIKLLHEVINNPSYPRPIYILGYIVHNDYVNLFFKQNNCIILENDTRINLLNKVKSGTIVFTAHGVSNIIRQRAREKGLTIVDATCPYVTKTYLNIENYIKKGYHILYIGKLTHPETEAILDFGKNISVIEKISDIPHNIKNKIAIAHQTTLSKYDVEIYTDAIKLQYPDAYYLDMICRVTQNRQDELMKILSQSQKNVTIAIIVGDQKSNNTNKLAELTNRYQINNIFISSLSELKNYNIFNYQKYIVVGGTSTPPLIVEEVYNWLKSMDTIEPVSKLVLKDYIETNN